jgi:hypothetical protein
METYIKLKRHNLMPELIHDIYLNKINEGKCHGLIRPDNLHSLTLCKLWAH